MGMRFFFCIGPVNGIRCLYNVGYDEKWIERFQKGF